MKCQLIALTFTALLALVRNAPMATKAIDHSGHTVIRVVPESKEQLEFLGDWQSLSSVDIWSLPSRVNEPVDIRVSPEWYFDVIKTLALWNLQPEILIDDVGVLEHMERKSVLLRKAANRDKAFDFENYHTYDEITSFLEGLEATNQLVTTRVGGVTHEGHKIVQVTISNDQSAFKPVIFFYCNIHAREWATAATCIWMINQLATKYSTEAEITALVDQYDWKFVPISNPDGYVYTWTTDRLWRKNRANNLNVECMGVDVNRNFRSGFGGEGASDFACSDTYHGPEAFSELESKALRDLIAADRGRVKAAFSIHTYSQLWMSPYSYKSELPSEYSEMRRAMSIAVDALTSTYGTNYTFGNSADTIYVASGVSSDHYYETEGVVHAYVIELRDTGTFGFILPAEQIVPTATETWNGIKALVNAV